MQIPGSGSGIRPASLVQQQGGGAEAIGRTERPAVLAGGGGGAAVDTSSSLERTHRLDPVAPHGLGSHAETRADAVELDSAAAVSSSGSADA